MAGDEEIDLGRKRHTAVGLLVSLTVLAAVVIAVVVFAKWQSRGLTYSIRFKDAHGILKGDKVQLSGIAIGEVEDVRLLGQNDVLIRLRSREDAADKVKQESTALIASPMFPNVSGQKVIEVYNPPKADAKPLPKDSTIEGQESLVALKRWQLKQKLGRVGKDASQAARALSEKLAEMVEVLKDLPESPEVKNALEKMNALADALAEKGKQGLDAFSKEWEEVLNALKPLLAQWKTAGAEKLTNALDAAKALWNDKGRDLRQRIAGRLAPESQPAEAPAAQSGPSKEQTEQ